MVDWGFPGYGPTVLQVKVCPPVHAFQASLVAALEPFVESGGTADAFVADPGEIISPTIIDWVEAYVPNQIGDRSYFHERPKASRRTLMGSGSWVATHWRNEGSLSISAL